MADRKNYYFKQLVTESELDAGFDQLEAADRLAISDQRLVGIFQGAGVAEAAVPNLTVDVAGPAVIYDQAGQRIFWSPTQSLDCSTDEDGNLTFVVGGGNARIISVFAEFTRTLSDSRVDGNGATIFFDRAESFKINVVAGATVAAGGEVAPALRVGQILLCDITLITAQAAILDADIDITRRQDTFVLTGTPNNQRAGTPNDALQAFQDQVNTILNAGIGYAGGGAWADGTTNPATTVELQLDKIIADLATGAGSAKIAIAAGTAWADGTTNPAEQLGQRVESIVADLATGAGAAKILTAIGPAWHDATANPAERVDQRLDSIISDLVANAGAARIGVASGATGLITAGESVQQTLESIETHLGREVSATLQLEAARDQLMASYGGNAPWVHTEVTQDIAGWSAPAGSTVLFIPISLPSPCVITGFRLVGTGSASARIIAMGTGRETVGAQQTGSLAGLGLSQSGLSQSVNGFTRRYCIEVYTTGAACTITHGLYSYKELVS